MELNIVDAEFTLEPPMTFFKIAVCPYRFATPTHHVMKRFADIEMLHAMLVQEKIPVPVMPRSPSEQEMMSSDFRRTANMYFQNLVSCPEAVDSYLFRNVFQ